MRTVLVLMAAAACGDDSGVMKDAGTDTASIDALVEEPAVDGTWLDTYHAASGAMTAPACATAPAVAKVDPTSATVTVYPGACNADGTFKVLAPDNLGTFYLRVQGGLYETTRRTGLDLGTDRLGRKDISAVAGVTLSLSMTGLVSWQSGDVLTSFAPNIGYYQELAFTTGGPINGTTTVAGVAPWTGYKIDSAKSDTLQLLQQSTHTTGGGLTYLALDRSFDVPAFTMTNNTAANMSGAFTAPTTSTLPLNINVASFHQFGGVVNPNVTTRTIRGTAYAALSNGVISSPSLVTFSRSSVGVTQLDLGTISHGDPFPAAWPRFVKIEEVFQVPYTWNSVSGSRDAIVTRVMPKSVAQAGIIDATLGPPVAPKFDGADAFTATSISAVPVLSWSAPTLGTPTDYEVQVYEVQIDGTSLKFISALRLVTKQTSLRIPNGYLLGQRQYVFAIRARVREGVDVYTTPLRPGASSATAEILTALVTTAG